MGTQPLERPEHKGSLGTDTLHHGSGNPEPQVTAEDCPLACPPLDHLPNPRILQKLAVPIIDTPKCNLLYSTDTASSFQPKAIKDDMLCAGFAEGKKDACKVEWKEART